MKFISIILTSSKFKLLLRCLKSVILQRKVSFQYDIVINVNTLNDDYYNLVIKEIPKLYDLKKYNIEIVRTRSNGRPGRGHNSCIDLFKERTKYDYLTMIDGDDLYYPVAFQRFELFIKKYPNIDLLHLMLNDRVHFQNEENYNYKSLSLNYKLISGFIDTKNWWKTHKMDSPFIGKIADNKTPSRILLCSRNIFNVTHQIKYSENAKLYDDYLAFCSLYEAQLRNEINTYSCSDTYIYLYNSLNDYSVSYRFKEKDHVSEQKVWDDETKIYTNVKNDNWNVSQLPYAIVQNPENFYILDKIKFAEREVINFELNKNTERYNAISKINTDNSQETFDLVEFNLLYLIKSGLDTPENIMNICKLYFKFNKSNEAFYHLFSLEKYPSLDNFEFIFNTLYNFKLYSRLEKYITILSRYDGVSEEILKKIEIVKKTKMILKNQNFYKSNTVNVGLDPNKKLFIYYTGYSGDFNGKNYGEKNVYGSELAAIKLCEKLKNKYNTIVLCETTQNLLHNGVYYINYTYYNSLITRYEIEYFLISRFTNVFIDLNLTVVKNLYFIFHDARQHNQYYNVFTPFYAYPLYYNIHKKFKKQLLVSKWQKENLFKSFNRFNLNDIDKSKFVIIGNGIDTSINKNNKFDEKDPFKFIYCSNPNRGLLPLCKILVKLHKKYPKITLDIYFNEFNDPIIKKYINENDFIKFHGKISNKLLWNKLSKSTFWIYPNLYSHETFCIACLEAMNNKNLVITRDFSALPELVNDKNLLIPANLKENDLVEYTYNKLSQLMNNRKQITILQNKLYEKSLNYDWTNVYNKLVEIL